MLAELWLSIVLAAVLAFVASSVIHMALPLHRKDFAKLPNEEAVLAAMRQAGVGRGDYIFPCPASMKDMSSPEMTEKYKRGPVGSMTVNPNGPPAIAKALVQWFVYCLVGSVFVAYLAGRTLQPGAEYRVVFRFASTVAFVGYGLALWQGPIWKGSSAATTLRHNIDALVYALLTGGAFAGFWPAG
jgi:hypothetical protein